MSDENTSAWQGNSSEIEWEEPPARKTGGRKGEKKYLDFADALRAHPGDWAVLLRASRYRTLVSRVKGGHIVAFKPEGAFESRAVTVDDNLVDIYVRFVGTDVGGSKEQE